MCNSKSHEYFGKGLCFLRIWHENIGTVKGSLKHIMGQPHQGRNHKQADRCDLKYKVSKEVKPVNPKGN